MKPFCLLVWVLFSLTSPLLLADELESWRQGLAEGKAVFHSTSPNGKWALFEINRYDIGLPTTSTAIAVVTADRSRLIGLLDCVTNHETDLPYKSYLTTLWSSDSAYLALHDSTPKNSTMKIYRVTDVGLDQIKLPDLLIPARAQFRLGEQKISGSGQLPIAWSKADTLIVEVRISAHRSSYKTKFSLQLSDNGEVQINPLP